MKSSAPQAHRRHRSGGWTKQRLQDRLFCHWQAWLYNHAQRHFELPTLDGRGGIAIDRMTEDYVCLTMTSTVIGRGGKLKDAYQSFFFTKEEARKVFARFHDLEERFVKATCPSQQQAAHLKPETWTGRQAEDWRHLRTPDADLPLVIASLIMHWDSCIAKPPRPNPKEARDKWEDYYWRERPLPKLIKAEGLPRRLAQQLRKHLLEWEWATEHGQ